MPSGRDNSEPALDSFAALDNLDPKTREEQIMLKRLALLTCHEMGHVLGLDHNFVASTYGRGSVMDYFAPRVKIRADGTADLSDAYMQGTGATTASPSSGDTARASQRLGAGGTGAPGCDRKGRDRERNCLGKHGRSALEFLRRRPRSGDLAERSSAGARLAAGALQPAHAASGRTQFDVHFAAATGLSVSSLRAGGGNQRGGRRQGSAVTGGRWAAAGHHLAGGEPERGAATGAERLNPAQLNVPAEVWKALAPLENRDSDPERFASSAGYLFSPQDGARAVSEIVVGGLLNPSACRGWR